MQDKALTGLVIAISYYEGSRGIPSLDTMRTLYKFSMYVSSG